MKIGMCTGVFDKLHEGHRNFILRAAAECDVLYVMVLSSWMTSVLKGVNRPEEGEDYRLRKVDQFLTEAKIKGKAAITDRLDFNCYKNVVDVFVRGEEQRVKWDGYEVTVARTPGFSTTEILKRERGYA